jgi:hypothetical protein|tara:strand:+ start:741 stop:932 length:192 start_codon:yes stop_codon:yes gene_type:complete
MEDFRPPPYKMTEIDRLFSAINQLDNIVELTKENEYKQYIHSRLISIKYELLRQLGNIKENNK